MPFYEYECRSCKYAAEVLQKISDAPLRKCPSCGKPAFRRLISAPVFRLKGSGWYETDFKSDKESKRNLAAAEREEGKSAEAPAAAAKDAGKAATPAAEPAKTGTPTRKDAAGARPAAKRSAPRRTAARSRRRRRGA